MRRRICLFSSTTSSTFTKSRQCTRPRKRTMASFLESAIGIAHEAGSLLQYYFERHVRFELKGDFDLVTEADRASEKLVVERLKALFPGHGIVAEEGGGHESPSEYRWYVDPLDGTTNFAHGYPIYNVTLALEKAGELICGVIFDPNRDELFTCEKGGVCTEMAGARHGLRSPDILADNALIHDEVLGLFSGIFRGKYPYPMPV